MTKKRKSLIITLVVICVAAGVVTWQMASYASKVVSAYPKQIIKGVSVAGISLEGMTKEEANAKLENFVKEHKENHLVLKVGDKKKKIRWEKMKVDYHVDDAVNEAYAVGRDGSPYSRFFAVREVKKSGKDLDWPATISESRVTSLLKTNEDALVTREENARLTQKKGKVVIIKEKNGKKIDMDAATAEVTEAIATDWNGKDMTVSLTAKESTPKYTEEDFKDCKHVMGTFSTNFNSWETNRNKNIENGANLINGTVLEPEQEFSVYDKVHPFTAENGYYLAPTIVGSKHVDDYGGGICQVSTTLYNAVIRAELKVKERHPHSQASSYVELSADAAIAGSEKDFKFVNDSDDLIYIESEIHGTTITFTIYGHDTRPANREVFFTSKCLAVYPPGEKVVEKDSNLEKGKKRVQQYGVTGYAAELWKTVKVDGKVVKEYKFNSSTYSTVPTEVVVGTKKPEKDEDKDKENNKDKNAKDSSKNKTTENKKTDAGNSGSKKQ